MQAALRRRRGEQATPWGSRILEDIFWAWRLVGLGFSLWFPLSCKNLRCKCPSDAAPEPDAVTAAVGTSGRGPREMSPSLNWHR